MRTIVVTNMAPEPTAPGRGVFVRDQVAALRRLGADVTLVEFRPGDYRGAVRTLRATARDEGPFDVVHAHFGLSAFPALAVGARARVLTVHGTDVRHPRTGRLTRLVARRMDLVAAVSEPLGAELSGGRRLGRRGLPVATLPCGVALDRFVPSSRTEARTRLGFPPHEPFVLFPADPARPGKRHDLAVEAADGARVRVLDGVDPADVPLWVNAANVVVLPSEAEGFGLAVLEALACDVPVVATPVGVHEQALGGVTGALCAPYDRDRWTRAVRAALDQDDPRIDGRGAVAPWSADTLAHGVLEAWSSLLSDAR